MKYTYLVTALLLMAVAACSPKSEAERLPAAASDAARLHAEDCEEGNAASCYGLALIYSDERLAQHHGLGVDADATQRLLQRACTLEPPIGCDGLVSPEFLDELPLDDEPGARQADEPAAAAGEADEPQGAAALEGDGIAADDPIAQFQLALRACLDGDTRGCFRVSLMHRDGVEGVPQDPELARNLWRQPLNALTQACKPDVDAGVVECDLLLTLLAGDPAALDSIHRRTAFRTMCEAGRVEGCSLGGLVLPEAPSCGPDSDETGCIATFLHGIAEEDAADAAAELMAQLKSRAESICDEARQPADESERRSPWCQLLTELDPSNPADCGHTESAFGAPYLLGVCPNEAPFVLHPFEE